MALNDVMHRDVSWWNVLCNPKHHYDMKNELQPEKDVKYIEEILYVVFEFDFRVWSDHFHSRCRGIPNPRCKVLITDLDHGELLDESNDSPPGRLYRIVCDSPILPSCP